jgi:hypothetical protein
MLCFAAFGYAQKTLPPGIRRPGTLSYSVKLTATEKPGDQYTRGWSLATTVYSKSSDSMAMAPADVVTSPQLRYTFSAQRQVDGVCSDTKIIATDSRSGNLNFLNKTLAAGEYRSFSVHVTGLPGLNSDATAPAYSFVIPSGPSRATTWSIYPPAGTKGPAQVSIGLAVSSPPANTTFTFKIFCGDICQPDDFFSGPQPQYSYISSYTLSTMMKPGSPVLDTYVKEFHTGWQGAPDCTCVAFWHVPKPNYYLVP